MAFKMITFGTIYELLTKYHNLSGQSEHATKIINYNKVTVVTPTSISPTYGSTKIVLMNEITIASNCRPSRYVVFGSIHYDIVHPSETLIFSCGAIRGHCNFFITTILVWNVANETFHNV